MSVGTDQYEVLALRYASRQLLRSEAFYCYHFHKEPDTPIQMDYYLWVARNDERTIVIDTGFDPAAAGRRGHRYLTHPLDALRMVGIEPETATSVIVSHCHYDHIGNIADFREAEVYVDEVELEFWLSPRARNFQFSLTTEVGELAALTRIDDEGRLRLLGPTGNPAPGVKTFRVGGHTPGQTIVSIDTSNGPVVLASDSLHFYEEVELDRPFAVVNDVAGMYGGYELLRSMEAEGATIIAGHDPRVFETYPSLDGAEEVAVRVASVSNT